MAQNIVGLGTTQTSRKEGQDNLGTANGAQSIDFDALTYDNKLLTINGDATLTLSATRGGYYGLTIKQDVAGNHTITWSGVTWSGSPPQPSAAPASSTNFLLYYDGTTLQGLS